MLLRTMRILISSRRSTNMLLKTIKMLLEIIWALAAWLHMHTNLETPSWHHSYMLWSLTLHSKNLCCGGMMVDSILISNECKATSTTASQRNCRTKNWEFYLKIHPTFNFPSLSGGKDIYSNRFRVCNIFERFPEAAEPNIWASKFILEDRLENPSWLLSTACLITPETWWLSLVETGPLKQGFGRVGKLMTGRKVLASDMIKVIPGRSWIFARLVADKMNLNNSSRIFPWWIPRTNLSNRTSVLWFQVAEWLPG